MEKPEKQNEKTEYSNVLVLKFLGNPTLIFKVLADLPKIIPADSLYTSQLLKNKGIPGYHLFCKITFQPMDIKKEAEPEKNDTVVEIKGVKE